VNPRMSVMDRITRRTIRLANGRLRWATMVDGLSAGTGLEIGVPNGPGAVEQPANNTSSNGEECGACQPL